MHSSLCLCLCLCVCMSTYKMYRQCIYYIQSFNFSVIFEYQTGLSDKKKPPRRDVMFLSSTFVTLFQPVHSFTILSYAMCELSTSLSAFISYNWLPAILFYLNCRYRYYFYPLLTLCFFFFSLSSILFKQQNNIICSFRKCFFLSFFVVFVIHSSKNISFRCNMSNELLLFIATWLSCCVCHWMNNNATFYTYIHKMFNSMY